MPKKLENKLKKMAKKKGLGKKRTGAYIYGTMKKLGMGGGDNDRDEMMEKIKKAMKGKKHKKC